MKNKKLLYILVPLTIIVWGAIMYNIFFRFHSDNEFEEINYLPVYKTVTDSLVTSYELLGDYPDPFRASVSRTPVQKEVKQSPTPEKRTSSNRRIQRQAQRIRWPNVKYNGIIFNDEKQLALIQINSKNLILIKGDERDQLKLIELYKDSVIMEYQGQKKAFVKSH